MLLLKAPTRVLEGAAFSSRQAGLALAVDFFQDAIDLVAGGRVLVARRVIGAMDLEPRAALEELAQGELVG